MVRVKSSTNFLIGHLFLNCIEKTKIKEKEVRNGLFFKKTENSKDKHYIIRVARTKKSLFTSTVSGWNSFLDLHKNHRNVIPPFVIDWFVYFSGIHLTQHSHLIPTHRSKPSRLRSLDPARTSKAQTQIRLSWNCLWGHLNISASTIFRRMEFSSLLNWEAWCASSWASLSSASLSASATAAVAAAEMTEMMKNNLTTTTTSTSFNALVQTENQTCKRQSIFVEKLPHNFVFYNSLWR